MLTEPQPVQDLILITYCDYDATNVKTILNLGPKYNL